MAGTWGFTIPGPLSSTTTTNRSSRPGTARIWMKISGRIPASSQASRALSTPSLTAVSRALRGLSKPSRWRFLVKNSETEISRWRLARSSALARVPPGTVRDRLGGAASLLFFSRAFPRAFLGFLGAGSTSSAGEESPSKRLLSCRVELRFLAMARPLIGERLEEEGVEPGPRTLP